MNFTSRKLEPTRQCLFSFFLFFFLWALITDDALSDLISHQLESWHLHRLKIRNANIPNSILAWYSALSDKVTAFFFRVSVW